MRRPFYYIRTRFDSVFLLSLAALLAFSSSSFSASSQAASPTLRFNEHIRPILANTCFQCHGPDEKKREADLRLDTFEGATRDLGGYAAVAPGKPEKSALLERILSHDKDEVMPPPKSKKPPITPEQIATLKQWIAEGATYQGHWAFQPLAKELPPEIREPARARNAIDQFILQKLETEHVAPSPEAAKTTLLRRVSLDLTGIPPSPEETTTFLNDTRPDAYERQVDRLLTSPHYGERWARHWLDQARYADSNGYAIDGDRDMWPYRDWVVRALNEDMPFNQFTIEQIAGDLLPNPTKSQRIASAFHRNTMINQEGGSNPEQFRNEAVVDRVNTTGAVWLGLTVGCAQCHSHKYDPISHQEFFKLFAFFNSGTDVNSVGETVEVLPGEIIPQKNGRVTLAMYEAAKKRLQAQHNTASTRQKAWLEKLRADYPAAPTWQTAVINDVKSLSGRDFALLPDGFVQLSKGEASKDTLTVQISSDLAQIDAVRVRFAPEKGKDNKLAPVTLSEFTLLIDGVASPLVAALSNAENPKKPARATLDGDPATAWIPDPNSALNEAHDIWFLPANPLPAEGRTLSVQLHHDKGSQFKGKFQIALASTAPLLPPDTKIADAALHALKESASAKKEGAQPALQRAFALLDLPALAAESAFEALKRAAQPAALMVMKDLPTTRPTFLHVRGDYLSPDEKLGALEPDTPAILPRIEKNAVSASRLDLAEWLVRPDNPLTPRVTVNRIWMRYFGQGLVETENDFGTQGTPPSHPALLDWLASNFISEGWSLKKLHRLIVTSATYRQSSNARPDLADRDPRNLWLARQNRVRLDAEILRDSALQASGLLDRTLGGPPVYPPQPEGVYTFTQNAKSWLTSKGSDRYRRAIYTKFYRSAQHPLTSTFDAPNFSTTCTRRLRSNTPLQALMLANDESFYEMAQATALQLWKETPAIGPDADGSRIQRIFQRFLSRNASPSELNKSLEFLSHCRNNPRVEPAGDAQQPSPNLLPNQPPSEAASWIALARGVMNTDEFITRE